MLKALVGSFAAFLAALFLSAASASAQDLAEQAHHHPDGLPGGLRRRRRRPHAAALAREVARPAPGHRLQERRRRQSRLGSRRAGQSRRLHLPARHRGDARRQRRALQARLRRRGRLHADLDHRRRAQCAGDQSRGHRRQERPGLHRQGEGGARQVQLRLDRQRHGHPSRLRRLQCAGRPRHGARALQGRARRHQLRAEGRDLLRVRAPAGDDPARQGRQGAPARRHHGQARRRHARPADHRRAGPAGLRELSSGSASSRPRASIPRSPPR